jgi:hypothetical protein
MQKHEALKMKKHSLMMGPGAYCPLSGKECVRGCVCLRAPSISKEENGSYNVHDWECTSPVLNYKANTEINWRLDRVIDAIFEIVEVLDCRLT